MKALGGGEVKWETRCGVASFQQASCVKLQRSAFFKVDRIANGLAAARWAVRPVIGMHRYGLLIPAGSSPITVIHLFLLLHLLHLVYYPGTD
jgi:hypothetical protein